MIGSESSLNTKFIEYIVARSHVEHTKLSIYVSPTSYSEITTRVQERVGCAIEIHIHN